MILSDRKLKIIISIFVVAIVVLSSVIIIEHLPSSTKKNGKFGPEVHISVPIDQIYGNTSRIGGSPNYTVSLTVDIYAVTPQNAVISLYNNTFFTFNFTTNSSLSNPYSQSCINESILLPYSFVNVSMGWESYFSDWQGINLPSLTMTAFKDVYNGSSVSVYDDYNNIPYDPLFFHTVNLSGYGNISKYLENALPGSSLYSNVSIIEPSINVSLSFPSEPVQVLNVNDSGSIVNASGYSAYDHVLPYCPGPGTETYYYTSYSYNTYDVNTSYKNLTGPLPLLITHFGRDTLESHSVAVIAASFGVFNDSVGLNSADVYVSSGGSENSMMSTSPSFIHIENLTAEASINVASAFPPYTNATGNITDKNFTTAILSLSNATYEFVHYEQYTKTYENEYKVTEMYRYKPIYIDGKEYCMKVIISESTQIVSSTYEGKNYNGNGTTGEITHIGNRGYINVNASTIPLVYWRVFQNLTKNGESVILPFNASGSTSKYNSPSLDAHMYGYSNANTKIKDTMNALYTFSIALGIGVAIVDLLSAVNIMDETTAEIVAATLTLVAKETELSADTLSMFDSISFISGMNVGAIIYGIHNVINGELGFSSGSSYNMTFYGTSNPLEFSVNGNTYQFDSPMNIINITTVTKLQA